MNAFCAIISGGEFAPLGGIENAACVIACDRGYEYAARCGIKPDLLLGDFDSYTGALPAEGAVNADIAVAQREGTAHGGHGVGIVLLHGQAQHLDPGGQRAGI